MEEDRGSRGEDDRKQDPGHQAEGVVQGHWRDVYPTVYIKIVRVVTVSNPEDDKIGHLRLNQIYSLYKMYTL